MLILSRTFLRDKCRALSLILALILAAPVAGSGLLKGRELIVEILVVFHSLWSSPGRFHAIFTVFIWSAHSCNSRLITLIAHQILTWAGLGWSLSAAVLVVELRKAAIHAIEDEFDIAFILIKFVRSLDDGGFAEHLLLLSKWINSVLHLQLSKNFIRGKCSQFSCLGQRFIDIEGH